MDSTQVTAAPAVKSACTDDTLLRELRSALCAEFSVELQECFPIIVNLLWKIKGTNKMCCRVNGFKHRSSGNLVGFSRFVVAWPGEDGVQYRVVPDKVYAEGA